MAGKAVKDLSDVELMNELKSLGLKSGPITPNTRWLFEKRLSKALGCDFVDSSLENRDVVSNVEVRETPTATGDDRTLSASSPSDSPVIFYGVCFDVDCSLSETALPAIPAVFTSKDEALKVAKKVKGSRFKGFKSKQEAELFSRSHLKDQDISSSALDTSPVPRDPVSNFKTPTPQQIVKFRAVIEKGSSEEFQEIVKTNPRYLIGPGDTPVILQEGFRYNALHIAVKNNRKEMCQSIVETLESQSFWDVLLKYEIKTAENSKRREFSVDMYLNTPDKGNLETPLHFACKFGFADIVEYLVSHPLTNKEQQNKYGETPAEVVCSRCSYTSSDLKNQIKSFLEDSFYVPLLGSTDNSTLPWIEGPWSPEVTDDRVNREGGQPGSPLNNWKHRNSPGDLPITVRAYAGPMSPSKAAEFYHAWKTPPKKECWKKYVQLKRKDDSRGVERIGRELAHCESVPWTEYWNFLGCYADLASPRGLKKLEDYFASRKERIVLSRLAVTPQRVRTVKSGNSVLKTPESRQSRVILPDRGLEHETAFAGDLPSFNEKNLLDYEDSSPLLDRKEFPESKMEPEKLNFELEDAAGKGKTENSKGQHIMEKSSSRKDGNGSVLRTSPHEVMKDELFEPSLETLGKSVETLCLHLEEVETKPPTSNSSLAENPDKDFPNRSHSTELSDQKDETDIVGDIVCKKKLVYNLQEQETSNNGEVLRSKDEDVSDTEQTDKKDKVMQMKHKMDFPKDLDSTDLQSSVVNQSPAELRKNFLNDEVIENTRCEDQRFRDDDFRASSVLGQSCFTVPGERNVEHAKSERSVNVVGSGNMNVSIFIQGLQPSKLDLDVLIAIGQTKIDSVKYPCIKEWKERVTSYSEAAQQSWPSPGSPRFHTRHKSLMWSC